MQNVILIMIFIATALLVYVVFTLAFAKRTIVMERVRLHTKEVKNFDETVETEDQQEYYEEISYTFIERLGKVLFSKKFLDKQRKKIAQAAILMKPEEFLMIKILLGLLFFVVFTLAGNLVFGIIAFVIGILLPEMFINVMKNKRLKKLENQLPEALSIIANGLRAGYSFIQALDISSAELDEPIAGEFKKALRDNSFGKPIEKSMSEIAERTGNEDIELFVTAFIIQRQVGGNLAEMLDQITATLRDRIKIKGEINVLTAQGRFSALIVSLLPFLIAMAIFALNPDYMMVLFTNILGIVMVAGAVVLEVVGIILIKNIVKIKL